MKRALYAAIILWVVGRHGTCQGTYMVLAVPVVITGEQKFLYGIIVLDEIGFQEFQSLLP